MTDDAPRISPLAMRKFLISCLPQAWRAVTVVHYQRKQDAYVFVTKMPNLGAPITTIETSIGFPRKVIETAYEEGFLDKILENVIYHTSTNSLRQMIRSRMIAGGL